MRLLRRYILTSFLAPWLYCLAAFIMVYVVYDLIDHLDKFVDAKAPLGRVLMYYAWLLPSVAWIIIPISLLLATLYSLYQLTKNNEITALKASGISLPRIVRPILGVGLVTSLAVLVLEQTVGPVASQWTESYLRSLDKRGKVSANQKFDLPYFSPLLRHNWRIRVMDIKTYDMESVTIEVFRSSNKKEREIRADKVSWTDKAWHLSGVEVRYFDEEGFPSPRFDAEGNRLPQIESLDTVILSKADFPEQPSDILNTFTKPELLSSFDMITYLRAHPGVSGKTRAVYLTNSHFKFATPWACLVVIILGIPFGNTTARKGAMVGVILCLAMFFGYYVMIIVCKILGHRQVLQPALAAWAPNAVMAALGAIQFRRLT
jgi:lipopolysaccharide export system permease protein